VNCGPTNPYFGRRPPLPTYQELGLESDYHKLKDRDEAAEDSYMVKLSHIHCLMQYDPPQGEFKWDTEVVLLQIRMVEVGSVTLLLDASEPEGGVSSVSVRSLAGEELWSERLSLDHTDVALILDVIANHGSYDRKRLCILFPSGAVADWKAGSSLLGSYFDTGVSA